jgi:hypothetical protein
MDSIASIFGVQSYSAEEVAERLGVPVADIEQAQREVAAGGGPRGIAGAPAAPTAEPDPPLFSAGAGPSSGRGDGRGGGRGARFRGPGIGARTGTGAC